MRESDRPEIRLGKMELQIMNAVWEFGKATVHDVKDTLSRGKKPAYSTVLTMMRKLEAKGYLRHEVDGRTYVYRPTITRRLVRHSMLGDLLDRLFDGSPELLVSSLIEQKRISGEELREIRRLIRERSKEDE
jgi:BlaI family penicillinase repressor